MGRLIMYILILGLLAGCNLQSVPEAKQQAYERWHHTRSQILYGMAMEEFKAGQLDRARVKTLEALSLNQKFTLARLLLGKIYIEQGKHGLACSELERVHQEAPDSAEGLYLLGVAQEKEGLLDDALGSYRQSHALDGANLAPVAAAAEVLVRQGQVRQAQLYIESYIDIAGTEVGMYELAGRLAMMRKEYGKAARYYQEACDLSPKNVHYAGSLARARFFAGQYELALENLQKLADSATYKPVAWVYMMLGDCYMVMGRSYRALHAHRRATELNPNKTGVWLNLAKTALAAGERAHAILAARHALALDGACLDATMLLGYALLRDGQIVDSLSHLKQAVKQHPSSPELRCVLGRAHFAAGNQAEAIRCYATALRIDPDNVLAKELFNAGIEKASKAH